MCIEQSIEFVQADLPKARPLGLSAAKRQPPQGRMLWRRDDFSQTDGVSVMQKARGPGPETVQRRRYECALPLFVAARVALVPVSNETVESVQKVCADQSVNIIARPAAHERAKALVLIVDVDFVGESRSRVTR